MQSHGITVPAGARLGGFGGRGGGGAGGTGGTSNTTARPTTTLPAGVTSQQWTAALQACASTLGNRRGANSAAFAAYRNCLNLYLQSHGGTTLPSIGGGFGGGGGIFGGGGDGGSASGATTTTNPLLQAADAHCANLRPVRGSTTTSTTT